MQKIDAELVDRALSRRVVTDYLLRFATDDALREEILRQDGARARR